MKNIRIEKLVINLCVGESGDKLTKACKVINENITQNQKNSLLIIF
jgi:ribosomal protein L5